jgi:GntR family transcriptional regulator/MocR family aminotransferase
MRPIYAQRRRALEKGAQEHWSKYMQVLPGNAGLHMSTRVADAATLQAIVACARQHLPGALPLSAYSVGTTKPYGLCIGYGGVEVDQIASSVRALGTAMRAACRPR